MNNHKTKVYRKLTIQIALVCTALTSLVLLSACGIAYQAAIQKQKDTAYNLFVSKCQTVAAYLSAEPQVDTEELLGFAAKNTLTIAVVDRGQLIFFAPSIEQEKRNALMEQVQKESFGEVLNVSQQTPTNQAITFDFQGQPWLGLLQSNYSNVSQWYNTVVLQPANSNKIELAHLRQFYATIFIAGVFILAGIATALAKFVTRPVKEAQTQQLRFLASASHELKSPLAVISSATDVLQRNLGNPQEQYQNIQTEIRQMSHLIDDMLVLTNSGTGQWTVQKQEITLADTVLSAYELYAGLMQKKKQSLLVELPDQLTVKVLADEQRILQIVTIFLDNANNYAPEGSAIILRMEATPHYARIAVIDHGPGISDAEKKIVFTYFYRMDHQRKPEGHYGMGLAIAAELAQLHKGSIHVTDTPGGGATFTLEIQCIPSLS